MALPSEKIYHYLSTDYADYIRKNLDYNTNHIESFAGEKLTLDFDLMTISAKESSDIVLSSDVYSLGELFINKKLTLSNDFYISSEKIGKEDSISCSIEWPTVISVNWNTILPGIEMLVELLRNAPSEHPEWFNNEGTLTAASVLDQLKDISNVNCPFNSKNFVFNVFGTLPPFENNYNLDHSDYLDFLSNRNWYIDSKDPIDIDYIPQQGSLDEFISSAPFMEFIKEEESTRSNGYIYSFFDPTEEFKIYYAQDWIKIDFKVKNPVLDGIFDGFNDGNGERFFLNKSNSTWNSHLIELVIYNDKILLMLNGFFNSSLIFEKQYNMYDGNVEWISHRETPQPSDGLELIRTFYIYAKNAESLALPKFEQNDSIITETEANAVSAEFQPLKSAISQTDSILNDFVCTNAYDIEDLIQTTLYR